MPDTARVLAACAVFEPGFRGGGPIRSLARILDTAPETVEVSLVTADRDVGADSPYPGLSGRWVDRGRNRVHYLAGDGLFRLHRSVRTTHFDLLYVNSLWSPRFSILPILAARLGLLHVDRILVAPRGELSPGALSLKSVKKRLFLRLWTPVLRRAGAVFHASADREAAEIRAACPWARVEINGDQFDLPAVPLPGEGPHDGPIRLVFIGRITPKKNLFPVLRALSTMDLPVTLDVYGPFEDPDYWAACASVIAALPASVRVEYRGVLAHDEVRETFARYDAFVFPTLGENFGHVIAESLSASCPVVCSDATPWSVTLRTGGGAVLDSLSVSALSSELRRLAALTAEQRWEDRVRAGQAYRRWRASVPAGNILEQVLRTSPVGAPVR